MSKSYYDILGVPKNASDEDIKKAYRSLASKHHPDKFPEAEKPTAEAKFKEIKEAFEGIETAQKRQAYDNPGFRQGIPPNMNDVDSILRAMRAAHEHAQRNSVPFVRLNLQIDKAFNGCTVPLNLFGRSIAYVVRAGLPPGVAYVDQVPVEDSTRQVQIQLNIEAGKFRFKQIGSEDGMVFSGDLEGFLEVDALDILTGGFAYTEDFLGKRLQVRIPSGFDPRLRLKVAGHGYTNWIGDKAGPRGDLYLQVIPKFKPVTELDPAKVEALYNATRTPPSSVDVKV